MTLLIKNVQIVGRSEGQLEPADVFVSGDKISAIGNFSSKKADEIIDGQGAYLSPGFIDVNTDSDHYLSLFDNPAQEDFLRQGVTTIIGGMCGASLAPLIYGTLESIRHWTHVYKVNVGWHTVEEFLSVLQTRRLGVNFATLVGHSTIRRSIVGENLRNLTKNEMAVFGGLLRRALFEGGFGLSVALDFIHTRGTPYFELKSLAKIAKERDGVFAAHLKNRKGELSASVDEMVNLEKDTKVKILVNHFLPLMGNEQEYAESLDKIANLPPDCDFHFDLYPYDKSVLPLYTFLPLWAQNGGLEVMAKNVKDEWLGPRILKDLAKVDPEKIVISDAPRNDFLVGYSLSDIQKFYSSADSREALFKLMQSTGLQATVFYHNIDLELIRTAIKNPHSLIASNAASVAKSGVPRMLQPERAVSTFTKFLEMAGKENVISLGEAINKITIEPAQKFNLEKRGVVKEGFFADLTVFKNQEIKFVVVNGEVAVRNGVFQNRLAGRIQKHRR